MRNYLVFLKDEWRWLSFGFLLTFVSSLGQTYFVALYSGEVRATFALSHGAYGMAFSAGTLMGAFGLFFIGRLTDTIELRRYTAVLLLSLAGATAVFASTGTPWMLVLAFFLMRLCGQGLCTHLALTTMARFYNHNRGKALSIATLGMSVGEATLPSVAVAMLAVGDWRMNWWAYSGVLAFVFIPLALFLAWPGKRTPRTADIDGERAPPVPSWTRGEMLRDPRFFMIAPALFGPPFLITGVFFHQVFLTESKGWTIALFAAAYLPFALAKIGSSLLAGMAIDRFSASRVSLVTMPALGLALALLGSGSAIWLAFAFMLTAGLHVGMHVTVNAAIWPELYGREHLGAIKALAMALGVFMSALAPATYGLLFDLGVSFETIAWWGAVFCVGATVLLALGLERRPALAPSAGM